MVKRHKVSLAALLMVVLAILAACGSKNAPSGSGGTPSGTVKEVPAQAKDVKPIRIGVLLPLSGPFSSLGIPEDEAISLAADLLNQAGGINGAMVELVKYNTESAPDKTQEYYRTLVEKDKVPVVLGPSVTAECYPLEPLSRRFEVPVYCLSAADLPEQYPWFFASWADFGSVSQGISNWMKENGHKSIGIIHSTDASGQLYLKRMQEAAAKNGLTVAGSESFNLNDVNMLPQVTKIQQQRPDVIYVASTGKPASIVLKNLVQAGLDLPTVIPMGNASYDFVKVVGGELPKNNVVTGPKLLIPSHLQSNDPDKAGIDKFVKAFEEKYKKKPDLVAGLGWDAFGLVVEAIKKSGASPKAIRDTLETMSYRGTTGNIQLSAKDHRGVHEDAVYMVTIKDGVFMPYKKP